jgi:ribosomal protein S18 acetylase RimI-like enzyme
VLDDGEPVGRLYLDVRDDEHRLIDIALLPASRGQGLGSKLMKDVLAAAAADGGKLVRIHVEENNPAMRLYKRLGFEKIEEQGVYHLMQWHPDRATTDPSSDASTGTTTPSA